MLLNGFTNFIFGLLILIVGQMVLDYFQRPTNHDNDFSNQNTIGGMISDPNLPYGNNVDITTCFSKYKPACAYFNSYTLFMSTDENTSKVFEYSHKEFCEEHCEIMDREVCTDKLLTHTKELYSNCPLVFCDPLGLHITNDGTDIGKHNLSINHDKLSFKKIHFFSLGEYTHTIIVKTSKPNIFGIDIEDCKPMVDQFFLRYSIDLENAYINKFGHLANPVFKVLHGNAFFVYNEDESAYLFYEKSRMLRDTYKFSLDMWKKSVAESGQNENEFFKNRDIFTMTPTDAKVNLHNAYTAALYEIFQPFCIGCSDGIIFDRQNGKNVDSNKNVSFMVVHQMQKIDDSRHQIYKFQTKNIWHYNEGVKTHD